MHNGLIALVAATAASWLFGAVWYTVLGRTWQGALGRSPEECKGQSMPVGPMVTSFVCELVMAFVLLGLSVKLGVTGWLGGAVNGAVIGLAFMATATVVNNAYPGRKLLLSVIDGLHWIGVAAIQGAILAVLA